MVQDQVKFFKGCVPQILLGPFLNTLTHMIYNLISIFSYFFYFCDGQISNKRHILR